MKNLLLAACSLMTLASALVIPASAEPKAVNYTNQIKPILKAKCYSCHNSNRAKGELDLTTKAAILKGGSEGKLFKVGKGAESLLVKRLKGQGGAIMPADAPPLTTAQIKLVTKWINEGAKF